MYSAVNGLLLIDKPKGWTSFDAVNYVRGIIARSQGKKPLQVKVGHTGTLDPAATGLLVLCIGSATKRAMGLTKSDKTYEAEITFGATSTTGDAEGVITPHDLGGGLPSREKLLAALVEFEGEIEQIPPAYSAIKVNGKKAYELARAGKPVDLRSRQVTVHELQMQSYEWPVARVRCRVSSGTYIRTLAEDVGACLGVGAYLTNLRRTEVAQWSVEDALHPEQLTIEVIRDNILDE